MAYVDDLRAIYQLLTTVSPANELEEARLKFHLEVLRDELNKRASSCRRPKVNSREESTYGSGLRGHNKPNFEALTCRT